MSADDAKWKSGVFVLCLLTLLIFLAEALSVWVDLLSGETSQVSALILTRTVVFAGFFLGVWAGWDWIRWVAGAAAAGYGLWRIAWSIALSNAAGSAPTPPGTTHPLDLVFIIHVAAGVLYVAFGAYVGLSEGATDFARHRRENGARSTVAVAFLALAACIGSLFAVKPATNLWIARLQAQALEFGEGSLRDMSAQWNPLVYEAHLTPAYRKQWPVEAGRAFFAGMKKYGSLQKLDHVAAPINVSLDGGGHLTIGTTYKAHVNFERLGASYETDIERGLMSGWTQGRFTLGFDTDPAAPAAATPPPAVPAPVPAAGSSPAAARAAGGAPPNAAAPAAPGAVAPKAATTPGAAVVPGAVASPAPVAPAHSPAAKP